ncbi:MAG: sigma 54-interacting transcriptional regulator [Gammaproteobacteria bacterium]
MPDTRKSRILLVDDDDDILSLLSLWLDKAGYEVMTANGGHEALAKMGAHPPQLVVTDLFMEKMDGTALMTEIHQANPLLPVIILSGKAQIPDAVRATHLGSAAFLTKPVQREEFLQQVSRILDRSANPHVDQAFSKHLVYRSREMAELIEQAKLVANSDITVFLRGETGTGKEVIAEAIHAASPRSEKPFIPINCGAFPEQLLESELFGHEKGAFTGATNRHEGLFQAANGGTLFLDEVGDMPLALQVKLLRVLQDFQVRPLGSTKSYPVDVRIISATHRDLAEAVKESEFREDLYYRLNVVPLYIPPLAQRREDILLLIEHFLQRRLQKQNAGKKYFAPEALDYLMSTAWPGNIRQLINVVDLCATLATTETIPLSLAQRALQDEPGQLQTLKDAKDAFERNYLISVLRITEGQVASAARIAGRNRTEFYKLLGQHELDPTTFRGKTQ